MLGAEAETAEAADVLMGVRFVPFSLLTVGVRLGVAALAGGLRGEAEVLEGEGRAAAVAGVTSGG